MNLSSASMPPLGAHNRIRRCTLFGRNVGARYRPTPNSLGATLAAVDRTRATTVRNSSWDVDVIKRISRDALGNKEATFRGDEKERNVLWTSLVKALQSAFETMEGLLQRCSLRSG